MEEPYIQSRQNIQIKNLVKLRERKYRDRQESFLIEGLREISHALNSNYEIETIYYCPDYFPTDQHSVFLNTIRSKKDIQFTRTSREAFNKATYREGPDGIIAIARQQSHSIHELNLNNASLFLILEGIEKPGNLGAILRSADGAGVDAVILVDCVLDLYNPNAIRSSQGLIFALPMIHAEKTYLSEWLEQNKIQCIATTPDATRLHWDINYQMPTALLFGSESEGLSDYWLAQANERVQIPMAGKADSLNVAASVAVCLYEAKRQRSK